MNDTTAQTSLFTSPAVDRGSAATPAPPDEVSARAAYQFALYARGVLLDVRRDRSVGVIHPDLAPLVEPMAPGDTAPRRVFVLADSDDEAGLVVGRLRDMLCAEVAAVSGGFTAWLEAGLPVAA